MVNDKGYSLYKRIKTFSLSGKLKGYLYIAAVLWAAVATQVIVNKVFRDNFKITDAFIKSETDEMKSSIEIVAEYDAEAVSGFADNIINMLAENIGLTIDGDIKVSEDDERIEYSFRKQAKQAVSELKVISLGDSRENLQNMKHYIIARLSLQKGIKSIDRYKKLLEASLKKLGVNNKQVTLKYEGVRDGYLNSDKKRELAKLLVDELHGELAMEYDEGDLYTAYAYTGMLDEFIISDDVKINIQLVISYNEATDKTKIYLATPIMNDDF